VSLEVRAYLLARACVSRGAVPSSFHPLRRLVLVVIALTIGRSTIRAAAPFQHPGILNNQAQLDFIRDHVRAGDEPWKSAFEKMRTSRYASLTYTPRPFETVECGPYSKPNIGCSDERSDATAAYTHALLWQITGKEEHAKKAIEIMNAWSAFVHAHIGHNAPLQSSWSASIFPRAADLIHSTYPGWPAAEVERFGQMLRKAYLPYIVEGRPDYNGNWEFSMIEAMMGVAVFLDDRPLFDRAIAMWRQRVPAYFYLTSDGDLPHPAPGTKKPTDRATLVKYWYGQEKFVDGLGQETCRDFGHLQMGMAAMLDTAETALIQGVDLYATEAKRITAAMEFHAALLLGKPIPTWLGGGKLNLRPIATWEIGYNHFHDRTGLTLPETEKLIRTKVRPTGADIFMDWETLTHAQLGRTGLVLAAEAKPAH
jgi:hypothetical protein